MSHAEVIGRPGQGTPKDVVDAVVGCSMSLLGDLMICGSNGFGTCCG
jgi:hypothetical protein